MYNKPGFGVDTAAHLYLLKEKLVQSSWHEDEALPRSNSMRECD
jgi:hypothetical protein